MRVASRYFKGPELLVDLQARLWLQERGEEGRDWGAPSCSSTCRRDCGYRGEGRRQKESLEQGELQPM